MVAKAGRSSPARDVLEHLEVPLRRPFHVLIPFALIVAGAVTASYVLPKRYESSTLILVESQKVPESVVPRLASESSKQRLTNVRQEILSRTRLETVITELNPYPHRMGRAPMSDIIEGMRDAISINLRGNDAFTVEFVHSDPTKAMQVANRLATLFIDETAKGREEQVEGASDFITTQLEEARQELEKREEALRRYKEQHMGALPEQMAPNLATLQRLQLEQQSLSESLRAAEDRATLLQRGLQDQRGGTGAASADPAVELGQLRAQLASLQSRYTDEHPDVKALVARVTRLEKSMADAGSQSGSGTSGVPSGSSQIAQAQLEVNALKAKQRDLERRIADFQARVELAPRSEQDLAVLTRDYEKLKDNYLALLKRRLDAQMAEKLEKRWKTEHFKMLDPAHLPERPIFPNRLLFLLGGLVVGLGAGIGCAFIAELLDHSVKSLKDLETAFPVPVLAQIPHITPPKAVLGSTAADDRG